MSPITLTLCHGTDSEFQGFSEPSRWVEVWMKCAATTGILRQALHKNFVQEM
jgi:hypothetical protein